MSARILDEKRIRLTIKKGCKKNLIHILSVRYLHHFTKQEVKIPLDVFSILVDNSTLVASQPTGCWRV